MKSSFFAPKPTIKVFRRTLAVILTRFSNWFDHFRPTYREITTKIWHFEDTPQTAKFDSKMAKNRFRVKKSKIHLTRFTCPWMPKKSYLADFCDFQPVLRFLILGQKRAIYAPPPIQKSSLEDFWIEGGRKWPFFDPKSKLAKSAENLENRLNRGFNPY